MKELRRRKEFVKPSVTQRQSQIRAAYAQRMKSLEM
jgi:hypothetical protein